MTDDIAIYLDTDNLVIGAFEADLTFDINLVLERVQELSDGRIALQRAYGDWRQRANMTRSLAAAGFELESTVRLGSNSKNLADMQMVVDAMSTLIDGQEFGTYVLITGDRDFAPLVQALRKRGKSVIGVGVKHTSSRRLINICDHFIFYDDLAGTASGQVHDELEQLLGRALNQLLQEQEQVPASLLKQRMMALSKGEFARTQQGKGNFSKFLSAFPNSVYLYQDGTTLFASRPGSSQSPQVIRSSPRQLADEEVQALLKAAVSDVLSGRELVRASILKQRMQELSDGAFDETLHGDKSFRKFLDRHKDLVGVVQEGSTLYVCPAGEGAEPAVLPEEQALSEAGARELIGLALDELLVDQSRVRASLLKQKMQQLSNGAFDEDSLGAGSFRQFLERYPSIVQIQQRGTTLMVQRPDGYVQPEELHLLYRSSLKKRGLRVIPSEVRLVVLKDLVALLSVRDQLQWRQVVDRLARYYEGAGRADISKSYVNDVMRLARRAEVLSVRNGNSLAKAPVSLRLAGDRLFQEAVIKCDATYLQEIRAMERNFDLDQASIALYETVSHTRYLQIILNRYIQNGQNRS
jgi:uncharacterized LabA/DUF88 family protein